MITVSTYAELEAAVLRDETVIRLEGAAKQFYERKCGDAISGTAVGAIPGLLLGGIPGALIGGAIGVVASNFIHQGAGREQDVISFLIRFYRRSSVGVTYIEVTHR